MHRGFLALAALLITLPSCRDARDRPMGDGAGDTTPKKATGTEFHPRLLKIAGEYRKYGRVDDMGRWAPEMCDMPRPSHARISESAHTKTHGQKLYYLFARQRDDYLASRSQVQFAGQVVVKESWSPMEVKDHSGNLETDDAGQYSPFAIKNGKLYRTSEKKGLFIMYKAPLGTKGTDEGWVYGTVTADGKNVTAAGRIASCMNCHTKADSDRMFGLK